MTIRIYTLECLATKEQTTVGYLRMHLGRLKDKGKPMEWRGYKFIQPGARAWLAIKADEATEILFNPED